MSWMTIMFVQLLPIYPWNYYSQRSFRLIFFLFHLKKCHSEKALMTFYLNIKKCFWGRQKITSLTQNSFFCRSSASSCDMTSAKETGSAGPAAGTPQEKAGAAVFLGFSESTEDIFFFFGGFFVYNSISLQYIFIYYIHKLTRHITDLGGWVMGWSRSQRWDSMCVCKYN